MAAGFAAPLAGKTIRAGMFLPVVPGLRRHVKSPGKPGHVNKRHLGLHLSADDHLPQAVKPGAFVAYRTFGGVPLHVFREPETSTGPTVITGFIDIG